MRNRPTARTVQMEERDSRGVSSVSTTGLAASPAVVSAGVRSSSFTSAICDALRPIQCTVSGRDSTDDVEQTAPAAEGEVSGGRCARVGNERVGGGQGEVGFRRAGGEVDHQRSADDEVARHEAPVAAVLTVIAVIAHDEVTAGGDGDLARLGEGAQANPPVWVDACVHAVEVGEVVAVWIGGGVAIDGVRLLEWQAVAVDDAVAEAEAIAGDADDALDEMHGGVIDGLMKDDDVAAVDLCGRQQTVGGAGDDLLIHEEEVADEEGRLHAFRRDANRLDGEGDDEERDSEDVQEGLQGLESAGCTWVWCGAARDGESVGFGELRLDHKAPSRG